MQLTMSQTNPETKTSQTNPETKTSVRPSTLKLKDW